MAIVQFRVDDELKSEASTIYEKIGLDLSSALRMFMKRSVAMNGIPFSMVLEKEEYDSKKAIDAMKRLNNSAKLSDMSLDEINDEIYKYRSEKRIINNIIDTNVIVSSMLNGTSIPSIIVSKTLDCPIIPLLNNEILKDYTEVLSRNKFGLDKIAINDLITVMITIFKFCF